MFLSNRNNISFDLFNSSNKNYQLKGDTKKKNDISKDDYSFILLYAEPIEINEEQKKQISVFEEKNKYQPGLSIIREDSTERLFSTKISNLPVSNHSNFNEEIYEKSKLWNIRLKLIILKVIWIFNFLETMN